MEEDITKRIEEIMLDNNLNKNRFARATGIDPSNLGRILNRAQKISDRDIGRICDTFGISSHWLRTGDGEKLLTHNTDETILNIKGEIINLARKLTKNKELISQLALENESIVSQLSALYIQLDKHQLT